MTEQTKDTSGMYQIEVSSIINPKHIKFIVGNPNTFGIFKEAFDKKGKKIEGYYKTRHSTLTEKDYKKHLEGEHSIGIYPIPSGSDICKFGAIDIDKYPINFKKLAKEIKLLELPLVLSQSKSMGAHLWLFMKEWTKAKLVRWTLENISFGLGFEDCEIFPKQNQLDLGQIGNFINLPCYNGSRCPIDENGKPQNHKFFVLDKLEKELEESQLNVYWSLGRKDQSGGRNNRLFAVGRYLKTIDTKNWEKKLLEYNKFLDDPLSEREVTSTIIHSLRKKDYAQAEKDDLSRSKDMQDRLDKIKHNPANVLKRGIKAHETIQKDFPDLQWVLDKIIPCGVCFLCGKAKTGKSFFALDLAVAVANGNDFLETKTSKGEVHYFDLESSELRINSRLKTMGFKESELKGIEFHYTTSQYTIPDLMTGLVKELEYLIEHRPKVKLIVIDTYNRCKSFKGYGNANAQEVDTLNIKDIQQVVMKHAVRGVGILFVHHPKKQKEIDAFDNMAGSIGLQSNPDGMIMFESKRKKGHDTTLNILPRDAEQQEIVIKMGTDCRFESLGTPQENKTGQEEDIIASLLQLTGQRLTEKGYHYDVPKGVRPQSVGYDLGYGNDRKKHQALQRKMHRMCDKGVIVQKEYGKYLPLEEKIDQKPMPF